MASSPEPRTAHEILCDEEAAAARERIAPQPAPLAPDAPRIQRIEGVLHGTGVVEREDTQ